jgi:hypothetical protein
MTVTNSARLLLMGAVLLTLSGAALAADEPPRLEPAAGPSEVGPPSVPTITPAVRDLPDFTPDPNLFGLEMKRREDFGFLPVPYAIKPKVDPLLQLQQQVGSTRQVDAFGTPLKNFAGQTSSSSPPDTVGDVGPNHFVQAVNQSVSTVQVLSKTTGANLKTFTMQSLTTASPCRTGFCDPVVLYDRAADRWIISELPSSGGNVCVYVSTTPDPTGTWYAYTFAIESSLPDYPKYGVWPQGANAGSYLIGVNAGSGGRDVVALDRAKMLAGQPATFQKWTIPNLPNSGFQLLLPSTMQGNTPPPNGEPALFMRPRDDEAQDGASTAYDLMEMWKLTVDWATPANSVLAQLPSVHIGDYDMTLCGMGSIWNCMPQPGTTQKIDPIREPLHFPLQYRNFGDHQTLVGTFPEDVDGTDHAALRWFELRKVGAGAWTLFQEGLVGGEAGVHRSVASIAMDGSGNIAMGYTRTGSAVPYYPSMYYKGRLATDPLGTMPQGEYTIQDATTSKTGNERWGDYSGIGIDPSDDCTFWYTSEYGGSGTTRVAAFKFDACGCLAVPGAPTAQAAVPQDNRIDVGWDDSATASIVQYQVYRATVAGGPYTQIAAVADSSPGASGGPSYTYHDDTVSGGTRYYYVVKSTDGVSCTSAGSNEVDALATGACLLAPAFAGVGTVTNPGASTCTLNLTWSAGSANCAGAVTYNVYRGTTSGFVPAPANRIATGLSSLAFSDAVGIAGGTTYYYVVRAVDAGNGAEDANVVQKSAAPAGPPVTNSWTDTFEGSQSGGGFDRAGWTKNSVTGSTNWVWTTARSHDGTHSWLAADVGVANDKVLVSPPFGVGPFTTVSFFHTYQFEGTTSTCYDAATLEYTTNAGAAWTVVPVSDFISGAYNGTANPSTGNPIGGKRAWCAGTVGSLTVVNLNLGIDANLVDKTIQLRWHEGDDDSVSSTGWYVDTVAVNTAVDGGACTPGVGTLSVSNGGPICESATLDLYASYSQQGVTYAWTGPNGFTSSAQNPSIPSATAAAAGSYSVTVSSAGSPVASNSTVASVTAEGGSCDDGNACTAGDGCSAGACVPGAPVPPPGSAGGLTFESKSDLSWSALAGATAYDVARGTLSVLASTGSFTSATDACSGDDVAATTYTDSHVPAADDGDWFLIRATGACGNGTYDDGSAEQLGPRDAAIAAAAGACP